MFKKILVPFDGSDHSVRALEHAISLAKTLGSDVSLTMMHVNATVKLVEVQGLSFDPNVIVEEEGEEILASAAPLLQQAAVPYNTFSISGDPAQEICTRVKDGNYDLIVMGSRGLGVLSEVLLGSVSHKVVQHADCPVLIVK